ncbi:MAG: hypothetical protein C5B54_08460 [Acidobacteria bacterium]|nr:MAG: hypothetical protein C5B54_08460 [Acidobacteriota bacterium]
MNLERPGIILKQIHFVRIAFVIILLNVAIFALVVLPNRQRITRSQGDYENLRKQVSSAKAANEELHARFQRLQQSKKDLDTIYSKVFVPRKQGVTDIRLELEKMIKANQVRRQDPSYNYKKFPEFKLQEYTLSLPVEGSYANIRRFINAIEGSEHFLILERVDLSTEKTSDTLNLDFQLSTYLVDNDEI